jgi:hypothetical protein
MYPLLAVTGSDDPPACLVWLLIAIALAVAGVLYEIYKETYEG